MKKPNYKTCTEKELWKYVAWHLAANGIETILVGGAVVAIYSDGIYRSGDLDFVLRGYLVKNLPEVMAKIGFRVKETRHYSNPECSHLIIDFASPPAAIGEDYKIEPAFEEVEGEKIYLYSPTDCVKDRLASYIHFRARECLDQAVLVADRFPVDLKKVANWCKGEGSPEAYLDFERKLKKSKP
jgi:hypothetical protein